MDDTKHLKVTVQPRLAAILKERGLTQLKLAEMSGVPQGSISRFDKNNRHEDDHLFSIAKALEIPIEELFELVEDESNE